MLSAAQSKILTAVQELTVQKGYPPSIREIAAYTNYASTSTVHGYITALIDKGYLTHDPTCPRTLKVIRAIEK